MKCPTHGVDMIEYPSDRSGEALYWCPVHNLFLGNVKEGTPVLHPHPSKERDRKEKKEKEDKGKEKDK